MKKGFLRKIVGANFVMVLTTTILCTGGMTLKAATKDCGTIDVVKGKSSVELVNDTTMSTFQVAIPTDESYVNSYSWKFSLEEDCVVKYTTMLDTSGNTDIDVKSNFAIYKDASMTDEVTSSSIRYTNDSWIVKRQLAKGTYFCRAQIMYDKSCRNFNNALSLNVSIQAVPLTDAINLTYKISKRNIILNVTNNVEEWMPATYCQSVDSLDSYITSSHRIYLNDTPQLLKKDDVKQYQYLELAASIPDSAGATCKQCATRIFKLDIVPPVISGAKTGTSPVTIRAKDSGTGIHKITINGKTIKSGTKITKAGSYTVKATDKVGNTRTVKFKIMR